MTKNERRVLKQFFLVVSKTMPKHTEVDSVHIEDLKSSGGLKEKTLKARKKVADEFDAYALSSLDLSLEDLIYEAENGDVSKLQTTLMQFFGTMTRNILIKLTKNVFTPLLEVLCDIFLFGNLKFLILVKCS